MALTNPIIRQSPKDRRIQPLGLWVFDAPLRAISMKFNVKRVACHGVPLGVHHDLLARHQVPHDSGALGRRSEIF